MYLFRCYSSKNEHKKVVAVFLILLNISVISYWFVTYHDREYSDITKEIGASIDDNTIVLAEPRFWLSTRPQPFYSIHHLKLSNLTLSDAFSKNKVNTVIVDFFVRSFMNENKELLIQDTIHTHCHKTKEFVDPLYPKENIEIYRCNL